MASIMKYFNVGGASAPTAAASDPTQEAPTHVPAPTVADSGSQHPTGHDPVTTVDDSVPAAGVLQEASVLPTTGPLAHTPVVAETANSQCQLEACQVALKSATERIAAVSKQAFERNAFLSRENDKLRVRVIELEGLCAANDKVVSELRDQLQVAPRSVAPAHHDASVGTAEPPQTPVIVELPLAPLVVPEPLQAPVHEPHAPVVVPEQVRVVPEHSDDYAVDQPYVPVTVRVPVRKGVVVAAAYANNVPELTAALSAGGSAEEVDFFGYRALTVAAQRGSLEAVQVLISHGAEVEAKDSKGKTALDWAKENQKAAVVAFLEKCVSNHGVTRTWRPPAASDTTRAAGR